MVIYPLASILEPLDFQKVFSPAHAGQPVEMELGSGDGTFLIEWAQRNRDRNFLGVERLLGRLRKIERKAKRNNLQNVRAIRIEASYLMKYLIPPAALSALHIYFPDPWPKRKHWRRRLINAEFCEYAARALTPNGVVYFRTDNAEYFAQMKSVFETNRNFSATETPAELAEVLTDFERDFLAKGIATKRISYRRIDKAAE